MQVKSAQSEQLQHSAHSAQADVRFRERRLADQEDTLNQLGEHSTLNLRSVVSCWDELRAAEKQQQQMEKKVRG
jgi:hypothetical protein